MASVDSETNREAAEESWIAMFRRAKTYYKTHRHLDVPGKDADLRRWILGQEILQSIGRMCTKHKDKLDQLDFGWTNAPAWTALASEPSKRNKHWLDNYVRLLHFYMEHGRTAVPYNSHDGMYFGNWLHTQRYANNKERLSDGRKAILDAIGYDWARQYKKRKNAKSQEHYDCGEESDAPFYASVTPKKQAFTPRRISSRPRKRINYSSDHEDDNTSNAPAAANKITPPSAVVFDTTNDFGSSDDDDDDDDDADDEEDCTSQPADDDDANDDDGGLSVNDDFIPLECYLHDTQSLADNINKYKRMCARYKAERDANAEAEQNYIKYKNVAVQYKKRGTTLRRK